MKIRLLSDLHLEFLRRPHLFIKILAKSEKESPSDVLVLAGDIHSANGIQDALSTFADLFSNVVFVSGNHEFYQSSPTKVEKSIRKVVERYPNLHWLNNSSCEVAGQRFLGGTFCGSPNESKWAMNDFGIIMNFKPWVYEQNALARRFLEANVVETDVVVTHHLPSYEVVDPKYAGSALNKFFVCSMDRVIERQRPKLWLHGHTHSSVDRTLHSTKIACNPYGYDLVETNPNFIPNLQINL